MFRRPVRFGCALEPAVSAVFAERMGQRTEPPEMAAHLNPLKRYAYPHAYSAAFDKDGTNET